MCKLYRVTLQTFAQEQLTKLIFFVLCVFVIKLIPTLVSRTGFLIWVLIASVPDLCIILTF